MCSETIAMLNFHLNHIFLSFTRIFFFHFIMQVIAIVEKIKCFHVWKFRCCHKYHEKGKIFRSDNFPLFSCDCLREFVLLPLLLLCVLLLTKKNKKKIITKIFRIINTYVARLLSLSHLWWLLLLSWNRSYLCQYFKARLE